MCFHRQTFTFTEVQVFQDFTIHSWLRNPQHQDSNLSKFFFSCGKICQLVFFWLFSANVVSMSFGWNMSVILPTCVSWEKSSSELLRILCQRNNFMGVLNTIVTEIENSRDIRIIDCLDVSFCDFHIHSNSRKKIELEWCYCKSNFSLAYYSSVISRDSVMSFLISFCTKTFLDVLRA